ncbi:hypothetical protein NQ176_g6394 [Zarea fungicola]|uniref:Uncharacterized protein n=1 Tax=Zarea fungicola TaxID=93591 RepID=A0ACC1N5Q7_9HYPO|nr:hypothetical protein NQ176_g6394 [Lecanicillium fungicola]
MLLPCRFIPRVMKRKLDAFMHHGPTPFKMPISTTILLDARERRLRNLLLDVANHDIDVAINSMTGGQFTAHLREHCQKPSVIAAHKLEKDDIGSPHTVARQPDKSKHLETAILRLFGLDLDFVNLRKETYADDSRNPQMEFGTAEEDALRRDATINALFYNLNEDTVEDFTGGLADMEKRLIRTPLEPLQTFKDDPLRVLRLVRFSSRLDFTIQEGTRQYMADPCVLDALKVKISRERVGQELEKMLQDKHPRLALQMIDDIGLYHAIFTDPTRPEIEQPDISKWPVAYNGLDDILQTQTPGSIAASLIHTDEYRFIAWNLAAVSPWMRIQDPPGTKRKANSLPPVGVIAREGFKAANKLTDIMAASHRHLDEILALKKAVMDKAGYVQERDRFGMAIRRWEAQGGSWRLQVLAALLTEALERLAVWPNVVVEGSSSGESTIKRDAFVREWQLFLDHLVELDVMDAPQLKRILDGRELARALGVKPGKWTGQALDVCVAWQLRNPTETDPTLAIEEVEKRRKDLGIPDAK